MTYIYIWCYAYIYNIQMILFLYITSCIISFICGKTRYVRKCMITSRTVEKLPYAYICVVRDVLPFESINILRVYENKNKN